MASMRSSPPPGNGQAFREGAKGHVLFVITEDWFFASHFLALAEAVRRRGFEVSAHLRVSDPALAERISRAGIRIIPSTYDRGASGRWGHVRQIWRFHRLFRRERPDIVHIISLRVVLLAGLAARTTRVPVRVHALTGMGLLGAGGSLKARLALDGLGVILRRVLGGRGAGFLFENMDDPRRLGLDVPHRDVLIVGGAGVDPEAERALPLPRDRTLRIAVVARMIHSKGIEVAVDALRLARVRGADVTLTLVGGTDSGNPRSFSDAEMEAFARQPGVRWLGRTRDIEAVWRDHHVACVPSLGGEGLPRALLEGAAAARAIVTTNTPGCTAFVRPMREGLIVPAGNAAALADAFVRLANDPDLVARLGEAARRRVLEGFTRRDVAEAVLGFYEALMIGRNR